MPKQTSKRSYKSKSSNRRKRKRNKVSILHMLKRMIFMVLLMFLAAVSPSLLGIQGLEFETILKDAEIELTGIIVDILEQYIPTDLASSSKYSKSTVEADACSIPDYSGEDYIIMNDNVPNFNRYDAEYISGEEYTKLDALDRCGTAVAKLHRSMMPTEKRGQIGQIKPSGWKQAKYKGLVNSNPPYLYNRCHLIAFALTGQNANELNLITGTRYMNATTMLPWETKVMRYLDESENHVLYRVTPYFKGDELLARGVELEAYSVEDNGKGISFHVFVYNVQPGVEIDYATGESRVQ